MKELRELLEELNFDFEEGRDEDEDTSLELEITAKKKEKNPVSLEQLFNGLIDE